MADIPQPLQRGQLILSWINGLLLPWLKYNRTVAGLGVALQRGAGGTLLSASGFNVTVDLRGQIFGPYNAADGRYVVVDASANTVTQQTPGTVRPDNPPQHEVWIDLTVTYGRVYIPRLG